MAQIIGNGMIAKSFKNYVFSKKCLLIASGVSYSLENRVTEFQREKSLIEDVLARYSDYQIIYFSTSSILQLVKTPYITHKINMENIIAEKSTSHLIFRLPQAVGFVNNSTLISFLVTEIMNDRNITVQLKARRNLIDVNDVARIVHHLVEKSAINMDNSTINIAAKHPVFVSDIVSEIAKLAEKKYRSTEIDAGESYEIPIDFLKKNLRHDDPLFDHNYWKKTLAKYVPLIANSVKQKKHEAAAKNSH